MAIDLMQVSRNWLNCRGFQHSWDHGPAPMQRDDTQKPVLWVTRGTCTSCGMKRWHYYVPGTCDPIGKWEYMDVNGMRSGMHLVTQQDARVEFGRRDNVGQDVAPEVTQMDGKRTARKRTPAQGNIAAG